jgi:hypothetical protein
MEILIATALIFFAAALRLLPHAPNFAPIAAVALFAGAVLPRRWSLVIPFGAMLLSDAIIGFYQVPVMLSVYSVFALIVLFGWWSRGQKERVLGTLGASLLGSIVFFLVTNAAVWRWGGLYPQTLAGLLQSYALGVPFFRNTLAGDLFYTTVLFGSYAVVTWAVRHRRWLWDRRVVTGLR